MHRCVCVCAHAEDVLYSSFCVSILQMASAKSPAGDDAGFPWQPVMVAGTVSESELALIHCHFTEMLKTHTHTHSETVYGSHRWRFIYLLLELCVEEEGAG